MREIYYNKLVRDNIPEIISEQGKKAVCKTLDEEQYIEYLCYKLREEVSEFLEIHDISEMADILEVLEALRGAMNISPEDLAMVRKKKAEKNGRFEKRILLEKVVIKR